MIATDVTADLLDAASIILLWVDMDGRIDRFNRYLEQLSGWRLEEVRGLDWCSTLVPQRDRDFMRAWFRAALHEQPMSGIVSSVVTRDGSERTIEWRSGALRKDIGNLRGVVAIGTDITDRMRTMEDMRDARPMQELLRRNIQQQARLLDQIFQHTLDNIVVLDKDFNFVRVSESYARACQRPSSDFAGRNHFELYPSTLQQEFEEARRAKSIYSRSARPFVFPDHPEWGVTYWDLGLVPFLDEDGEIELFLFTLKDVTARIRANQELRKTELRLAEAQHLAHVGSWEVDLATQELWWSDEQFHIYGLAKAAEPLRQELFLELVHPEDRAALQGALKQALSTGSYEGDHRVVRPSCEVRHIHSLVRATYDEQGKATFLSGTNQDITERKLVEQRIAQSLREKETLLKEIHHRVKNNLQIISGLLYFQMKKAKSPEDHAALAEGRTRLLAMILVHEKLYQSPDLSQIEMGTYVRSLLEALAQSYEGPGRIRVEVVADDVYLPIESALPNGMILCELLTNVYKYAFPAPRTGTAVVSIRKQDDRVLIGIDDDGIGFPAGFDPRSASSFGWQLVCNLVMQLDGTLTVTSNQGVHVQISLAQPAPVH